MNRQPSTPAAQSAATDLSLPADNKLTEAAQDAARPLAAMRSELVALALGLGVILIGVKAALLPFETVQSLGDFFRWILRLGIVVAADVAYLATLFVLSYLAAALAAPRIWPRRTWRAAVYVTFYLSGLFAIFSLDFFYVTMQPFSVRVLSMVGGAGPMVSSVTPYLTPPMVTALCLAPLAMILLPRLLRRVPWFRHGATLGYKPLAAGVILVAAYASVAQAYIGANWNQPYRWERRISCNPQWEFVASCLEEVAKEKPFTVYFNTGFCNTDDFTAREQETAGKQHLEFAPLALEGERPKNVLIILLESTAAEYLSLYGASHDTTPNLQRLVAERASVVFDHYYVSAPYSCKSLVSLSASVYPRLDWNLIVNDPQDFDVPALTEVLRDRGYRTCYAHSGFWSWMHRHLFLRDRVGTLIDAETIPVERLNSWGVTDRHMFEATLDWIDADPEQPFCLLAYTIETHHPYATPQAPLKFDVKDRNFHDYLNALRAADENIAWYLGELDQRGLLDDTLVVITADHGEAFGQHNQRSHNFGIYECNVHTPMVLMHPSLKNLPRHVSEPREQVDVAPTILQLLDVPAPAQWQGRSLLREDDDRPAYFFCVGNNVVVGLRDGKYKYLYHVGTDEEELFDIHADPAEAENLASQYPDRCQDYRGRVSGWVKYHREYLRRHGVK